MLEARGNDIYMGGRKIGWITGSRIYDHTGKEQGYFTSDAVYDVRGERLAHVVGDYVYSGTKQMELEDVIGDLEAVGLSNTARVAVTTFFGE